MPKKKATFKKSARPTAKRKKAAAQKKKGIVKSVKQQSNVNHKDIESLKEDLNYIRKHLDKLWEYTNEFSERVQDLEIQSNYITHFLLVLCQEKMKIKPSELRKLIRQAEDDVNRESEVLALEDMFSLGGDKSKIQEDYEEYFAKEDEIDDDEEDVDEDNEV